MTDCRSAKEYVLNYLTRNIEQDIVSYGGIDASHKKKIHIVSDDEIPEIPDGTDVQRQTEESTGIDSALRKLSDDERQIVLLSVIGGFNSAEIAKITDFARGTVRSKLSRALKKMKAELEGD